MYGFIYNTLRTLVVKNFGEIMWNEICVEADCIVMKDGIVERHYYDEAILTKVGTVAERKLGIPLEKIYEMFGGLFFDVGKRSGHSSMLRTLGHNLYGFLINLDSLHDHLSFTYTEMQAPSFLCEKTHNGLTLHYFSQRPGLSSIVIGIVQAVAKDFYLLDINMKMIMYEKTSSRLANHYTYHIDVKDSSKDEDYIERLTGEKTFQTPFISPVGYGVLETVQPSSPNPNDEEVPLLSPSCPFTGGRSQSTGQMIIPGIEPLSSSSTVGNKVDSKPTTNAHQEIKKLSEQLTISELSNHDNGTMPNSHFPRLASHLNSVQTSIVPQHVTEWPISQHLFQTCFPFHILFDRELRIRFMGVSLARLFPEAIVNEEKLTDHLELIRPALSLTYKNIRSSIQNIFIMCTKSIPVNGTNPNCKESLQFRGQMIPTSSREEALILFLGSPRVNGIKDLEQQGLYLSDIPVHDVTRDLLLLNRHFQVEMCIAKELEETRRDLQVEKTRTEEEKQRADELLHAMLPHSIANELKRGLVASAMDYPKVTILFSDIKGFTNICNQCTPMQVVGMLNDLYTRFDSQLEKLAVYKVETIGDAYMVAAGLLDTSTDHAAAVTNMAFAMREQARNVMDPVEFNPLKIRIGIHSGGVVAGIVGKKMPRYCLFGDSVNTASRMESHGEPGHVHISAATYELLVKHHSEEYTFYNRGEIEIKGLGLKQTYFVELPQKDGPVANVLVVKSDSPPPGSRLSITNIHDPFVRNSSFVKFSTCTIVNVQKPCSVTQPDFTVTIDPVDTTEVIEMIKPQGSRSNLAVTSNPIVEPSKGKDVPNPPSSLPALSENTLRINQVAPTQCFEKTETAGSFRSRSQSEPPSTEKQRKEETELCTSLFISNDNTSIDSSLTSRNPKTEF